MSVWFSKFSNKVVSKLVIGALNSIVTYQIEALDERNAMPQKSARSESECACNHRQKFVLLKLSGLTELNRAESIWVYQSWPLTIVDHWQKVDPNFSQDFLNSGFIRSFKISKFLLNLSIMANGGMMSFQVPQLKGSKFDNLSIKIKLY